MALITCKDCQKEFSTDAKRCPNCGAKRPPKANLLVIFLVLFFILSAIGRSFINDASTTSPPVQHATAATTSVTPPPKSATSFGDELRKTGGCDTSVQEQKAAGQMIRALGYDCRVVDGMCPYLFKEGSTVYCNNGRYNSSLKITAASGV
jgi:hypothetical protein